MITSLIDIFDILILGSFFSFGGIMLLRASPLNKIKKKPISCNVCMSFWFFVIYTVIRFLREVFLNDNLCPLCFEVIFLETLIYGFCVVGIVKILTNIFYKKTILEDINPDVLIGEKEENDK